MPKTEKPWKESNIDYMVTPDAHKAGVWWILWYDDKNHYIAEDEFHGTEQQAEERARLKYVYLVKRVKAYWASRGIELKI